MKKIVGLCLVVLLSSVSVSAFARGGKRGDRCQDTSKRCERIAEELKLNDMQAADFNKIDDEFAAKMKTERDAVKANRDQHRTKMLAMRDDKNAEVKKILTDEQYKQYLDKQQCRDKQHSRHAKGGKGGKRN